MTDEPHRKGCKSLTQTDLDLIVVLMRFQKISNCSTFTFHFSISIELNTNNPCIPPNVGTLGECQSRHHLPSTQSVMGKLEVNQQGEIKHKGGP